MYYFMSLEQISNFLLKFGIDFNSFSPFETSLVFILFNIYKLIAIFVFVYIVYRLFLKIYDFVIGF